MKNIFFCLFITCFFSSAVSATGAKEKPEFYKIVVYHYTTEAQETALDNYLSRALLPALRKLQFNQTGIFKPIANDTASDKRIYVITHAPSLEVLAATSGALAKDAVYTKAAKDFTGALYLNPPYNRYETILLKAFNDAPSLTLPKLSSPKQDHIYELRSYESPTDDLYTNKVHMFNEGGEVELFASLQFNAVFYGDVISGCSMPNLMYMTSFENMQERDEHWKRFGESPVWKKLSSSPFYQNNVSSADIILMRAAPYSEY